MNDLLKPNDAASTRKGKIHFGTMIKEIREPEVVIADPRTHEVKGSIPNDCVLALNVRSASD